MKVLVLCRAGLARSHAMVWTLKSAYRMDALAAGLRVNSPETLDLLSRWADRIVVMDQEFLAEVKEAHPGKVVLADVGPDVWGNPIDPDLRNRTLVMAQAWQKDGFEPRRAYSLRPKK